MFQSLRIERVISALLVWGSEKKGDAEDVEHLQHPQKINLRWQPV
jgi:hypothetical protein